MSLETILLIIASGVIAITLALLQYSKGRYSIVFIVLRSLTIFAVLVLLINQKFKQVDYFIEKPVLTVLTDNSSSIEFLDQASTLRSLKNKIKNDPDLNERFNIQHYSFDNQLNTKDSLTFNGSQTNVTKALGSLEEINRGLTAPVILLTDGNQTYGSDYEFSLKNYAQPIFPVILGDTIKYTDFKIQQLNVNRYTYLKNKFPVEIIINYEGQSRTPAESINTRFVISSGENVLYSENITLSPGNNSEIINVELAATSIGIKKYKAEIIPLSSERNTSNNSREFAVEVIDQKTDIVIISDILHPDLGSLKKIIESNEQRSLVIKKPIQNNTELDDFELIILYQPNNKFNSVLNELNTQKKNFLIITGTNTDWTFLNKSQGYFSKKPSSATEDVQPVYNSNFSSFLVEDINFEAYPPLKTTIGDVTFTVKNDVLLTSKIGSIETGQPLLVTFENTATRGALLLGEDIWKWRAQSYLINNDFEEFDTFFGKIIQYLTSTMKKERLNLSYEPFYYGKNNVRVLAEFFDKNYIFNPNASLKIQLKDKSSGEIRSIPLLLKKNNYYEADLSLLPASEYEFTVTATNENISKSGSFSILDFEAEKQFLNPNATKLTQLAANTGGESFYAFNQSLIDKLLEDNRFKPVQKSKENIVPLIDWKWLLALIALTLSAEWFFRKYNGLI